MAYFAYFILLKIIAIVEASKSKSVNLALETVLEFDNKDDLEFIDTMQNFLRKLKNTITKNRVDDNPTTTKASVKDDKKKNFVFTDFLVNAVNILKSYKDHDLKDFISTLQTEVKLWQTRKDFHEITEKLGTNLPVSTHLQSLKNSPATEIRRKLRKFFDNITATNRNGNKGFINAIMNYVYKKESEASFRNILNNLKLYMRSRSKNLTELEHIIRDGIITITDPLLKLNPQTITNLNRVIHKYIPENDMVYNNDKSTNIKMNEFKLITSRHKHEYKKIPKDNEVLDYIEDHMKVINKYLTTTMDFGNKAKLKLKQRRDKTSLTTNKNLHTTKSRKHRKLTREPKINIIRPHKMKTQWTTDIEEEDEKDDSRMPVLINLSSNDDSELNSGEPYLSTTKRHKKSTRSKVTPKKPSISYSYSRTTKKYRKAFKTSPFSVEGLSIEHFGSLFGSEFHRKSNSNDTFIQNVFETILSTVPNNVTITRDDNDISSKKIQRPTTYRVTDASAQVDSELITNSYTTTEKQQFRSKNQNEREIEEDKKIQEANEKYDLETESIKIKGNIVIENPSDATNQSDINLRTSRPVQTDSHINYNVSRVTKYFNVERSKPTMFYKAQNKEILNKTNVTPSRTIAPTFPATPSTLPKKDKLETDDIKESTTDHLENEIEDMMDKYNSTTISVQLQNFIKAIEGKPSEDKKVKELMQADLAKLLAPPSTKPTVTQLFTDPFDDIDAGADIL